VIANPAPADAWIVALAGYGLAQVPPLDARPAGIEEVVRAASGHKLIGVLAGAVAGGALDLEPDEFRVVAAAHEEAMNEALYLEEVLVEAIDVLAAVGIDHRVLKGSALAHVVHPDPSERCFGDNDVLVAAADIDAAVAALVDRGAVRPVPPLSASYDRRFAKSVTLSWAGTELDLHRTLAAGPYGLLIDLDDLTRDPVEYLLGGRALRTLPTDQHLLHGAIHVALGDVEARLGNVRDLALLSRRPSLHCDAVVETAARWDCAAPVALGLRMTAALGHELSPIEEWAQEFEIGESDRRRLEAYSTRSKRFRRQALASLRVLGWRDRMAFTRALLVPSGANRAARGRSRRSQLSPLRRD
jgi:hypothetical protein